MSVFWKKQFPPLGFGGEAWGYDGDYLHGHVQVNYWSDRETVEAELDRQMAEIKAGLMGELERLAGGGS
jgi:hypothetical protein